MIFKDYYNTLGIAVNATSEEIKQAYRRLAQKYHPDVNQAADAEEQFKEISAAYDVLKDPAKRALYNAKRGVLLPKKLTVLQAGLAWLRNQKNAINQKIALFYAKKQAADTNAFRSKNYKVNSDINIGTQFIDFYSHYKLFFKIGLVAIIGITIVTLLLSLINNFQLHARQQQMTEGLLNNEVLVATTLEKTEPIQQIALLQNQELKAALLQYYLHQIGEKIIEKLFSFDKNVQIATFYDDETKNLLINYYLNQIEIAINQHNFNHATQLLKMTENYYPNAKQLVDKREKMEHQREQQLVLLTQKYMRCLQFPVIPDNCIAEPQQIYFDLQLLAAYDTDLVNKIYKKYTIQTLVQQQYSVAEQLVKDWEQILAKPIAQQVELKSFLSDKVPNFALWFKYPYLIPKKSRISMLKQSMFNAWSEVQNWKNVILKQIDSQKISSTLVAFMRAMPAPIIKETITTDSTNTEAPIVSEEITTIDVAEENEEVIAQPDEDEITNLLKTCQLHLDANRLATGKPGTALECYQTVLAKEANNVTAQVGLKKIEQTYRMWLETALFRKNIEDAETYFDRLRIVNSHAADLEKFRQQVKQLAKEAIVTKKELTIESIPTPSTKKPQPPTLVEKAPKAYACEKCNCTDLYQKFSLGGKPLTVEEQTFLDDCGRLY